mgnify:CR=1 FL=1
MNSLPLFIYAAVGTGNPQMEERAYAAAAVLAAGCESKAKVVPVEGVLKIAGKPVLHTLFSLLGVTFKGVCQCMYLRAIHDFPRVIIIHQA